MEINRTNSKTLALSELDLFFVELLRQIPVSADVDDCAAAKNRLFSSPTDPAKDPHGCEDWKSYVEPELRSHFKSMTQTVKEDLDRFREMKDTDGALYELSLSMEHMDAWLNSLNQARLALAARFHFTDRELEDRSPPNLESVRDLSLFQIHFYGFLQEVFLREMN